MDKIIREAYFGWHNAVYVNFRENGGYFYDMVSQFPNLMLNDMPVGNPVLTNENSIDNFCGFCIWIYYFTQ